MALLFTKSLTRRLLTDNISFLAGGVAFYGLLALFPAMAALVSLFGIFAKTGVLQEQLLASRAIFPPEVFVLLSDQLAKLAETSDTSLSITAIISLIIALVAATRGTKAMLSALNMVFRVQESRPWWLRQSLALFITIGGLLTLMLALVLIVAIPLLLNLLPPDIALMVNKPVQILRWVILGGSILGGLFILFAFGPNRRLADHRLAYIVIGAAVSTTLWVMAALVGTWFAKLVPEFHAAYGSLSAVVVLMLWVVVSAYTVLFGGAVIATLDQMRAHSPDIPPEDMSNASAPDVRD